MAHGPAPGGRAPRPDEVTVRFWAAALLLVLIAACGKPAEDEAPRSAYGAVSVEARPLPLNPRDAAQTRVGRLVYAGGLQLTATNSSRLHGLSGIDVAGDGKTFVAVTDFGDLVRGRFTFDGADHLSGVADVTLQPLLDGGGKPFGRKKKADAEDISFMELDPKPDAGLAVSFEQNHRVLAYSGPGAPARLLFKPSGMRVRPNQGMEGLAARCAQPGDGKTLWVGFERGEISNRTGLAASKRGRRAAGQPSGFALSGLTNRSCQELFVLYRAYDPIRGFRAVIGETTNAGGVTELARLSGPLTRGNMEGLAVIERSTAKATIWRFYLVSDDGFDPRGRRTLLMAFDWIIPAQ